MDYKINLTQRHKDAIRALTCVVLLSLAVGVSSAQTRRGMTPADILRVADVSDAQISPTGALVAYVVTTNEGNERRSSLWLVRADIIIGGEESGVGQGRFPPMLIPLPAGMNATRPRWSPDGRRLAFYGSREKQSGIWLVSPVERATPRFVAAVRETNFHIPYAGELFVWSPDGRRIAFISATEDERSDATFSSSSGAATGGASSSTIDKRDDPRIIDRIQYKSRTSFSDRLRTHVWLVDLDDSTTPPRQLTAGAFNDHALTWSPRGDEIAFLSNREPDPDARNNSDIYVVGATDARTRRVTETQGCEYEPQWSPDGRFIAYTATTRDVTTIDSVSEDAHVWIADPVSGSRRELSGSLDRRARAPHWSPDGATVFFLANDRGRTNLYGASVDGSRVAEAFGSVILPSNKCRALMAPPILPPFQITGFSLNTRGNSLFALTVTDPTHPAEVWLLRTFACLTLARLSGHNDALVRSLALVQPETFTYKSFDGTPVQAWLMKPANFHVAASARYPVIVTIHGGPHGMYGENFDAIFQAYAARGYAVLFINPRGSNGYGQKFSDGTYREWGGGDYRDLMAGVDEALNKFSWLDGERMGVTGASYGGFMTNWMITQTPRFRAAVARASVSNLISFYATSLYQDLIQAEFGGLPSDDYDLLWRWSPLRYVRDARTPTLFIHGEQDNDVHITQAEEMYTALRVRGVEAVLARYPREGHSFHEPLHRQDALERTLAWFDKHLN